MNRILKKLTAVSKRLGKINMVVDKLQFRNLLDLWCKPNRVLKCDVTLS